MSPPSVAAVITAHDRRDYLPEAIRSALASGADEVIVVRNFADPIPGCEGRYRDVRCDARPTAEKQARGTETATSDVVAFLDDDDIWEASKVPSVRAIFDRSPDLVYFCHAQRAIDASGAPVVASHPELVGKDPTRFATADRTDLRTLVRDVWPGNNSSTVVLRNWAMEWLPSLRETGWSCDLFWFVAALLSGRGVQLSPAPLVHLRLHDRNMSQTRGSSPEEFRGRHAESSARFAASYEVMTRLVNTRLGRRNPMSRYLERRAVAFRFFADLENGVSARSAAWRTLRRGPGVSDRGVLVTALVALLSPQEARQMLYRSSERRWRLG